MAHQDQTVGVGMTAAKTTVPVKQLCSFLKQIDVQYVQASEVKTGPSGAWIEDMDKSRHTCYICAADCDAGILPSQLQIR